MTRSKHRVPFVPTADGPGTWADIHGLAKREQTRRATALPQPPDICAGCGERHVLIGRVCFMCLTDGRR